MSVVHSVALILGTGTGIGTRRIGALLLLRWFASQGLGVASIRTHLQPELGCRRVPSARESLHERRGRTQRPPAAKMSRLKTF